MGDQGQQGRHGGPCQGGSLGHSWRCHVSRLVRICSSGCTAQYAALSALSVLAELGTVSGPLAVRACRPTPPTAAPPLPRSWSPFWESPRWAAVSRRQPPWPSLELWSTMCATWPTARGSLMGLVWSSSLASGGAAPGECFRLLPLSLVMCHTRQAALGCQTSKAPHASSPARAQIKKAGCHNAAVAACNLAATRLNYNMSV